MAFTLDLYPLDRVFFSGEHRIIKVSPVEREGRNLVKVDLLLKDKALIDGKVKHFTREGSVWLDPAADWILRESELRLSVNTTTTKTDFRSDENGTLAPVRWTKNRFLLADQTPDGSETQEYKEFTFGPTPLSEFTLNAAGLRELAVPGVKSIRSWTPYVLISLGLLGAVFAVVLRWFAGRRTGAAS